MRSDRPSGPISRIVGLYQMVLRRTLEHFLEDRKRGTFVTRFGDIHPPQR